MPSQQCAPLVAGPEYAAMYEGHGDFEKNYWGCITAVDDQMGRLKKALEDKKLDNTILFYASDNGPEGKAAGNGAGRSTGIGTAAHLSGRKRSLEEGGIRVPGFIHWPAKIKDGRVSNMVSCTSDYLPTIVDLLELKPETRQPIDGVSLLPLIEGKEDTRPIPLGFSVQKKKIAWMEGDLKLSSSDGGKSWSLYDISKDPAEKHDLSEQQPQKVEQMKTKAMKWNSSLRE